MKTSDGKHNLMEQNWEIWKRQIRNNVKYSLLGLLVFHVTILWLTDFRYRDLGAITKPMQAKKVSEPTFLHQIKQCFGILFGLSAQVNMAFIFDINTNLNENYKEMS
jgi:hypothetical protein